MFTLPEAWVWDFWLVDDGQEYHLFFLYASRALKDPEARHYRASVGHAVSSDLTHWERVTDALVRSDAPRFDDLATWTGSIVQDTDGTWFMFYTAATLTPAGNVQTIAYATSTDLHTWEKAPGPVLEADPRWYEKLADGQWHDEAFRDPWVLPDPGGNGWHMLITARANHGPAEDRGVLAHGWSPDLRAWTLLPPLTEPGEGYGQLEVPQVVEIAGQTLLVFNCLTAELTEARRAAGVRGGVWVARAESPTGPYAIAEAETITDPSLYVGRLIQLRGTDQWVFLAFANEAADGSFVGGIIDPEPVHWDGTRLVRSALTPAQS